MTKYNVTYYGDDIMGTQINGEIYIIELKKVQTNVYCTELKDGSEITSPTLDGLLEQLEA